MIYMILIDNNEVDDELLDQLILFFHQNAFTSKQKRHAQIFEEYLRNCKAVDAGIQKEVTKKISDDLISVLKVPFDELDDFSTLEFELLSKKGRKIKKREQILYRSLYEKHLTNFDDLISRLES